MTHSAGPAGKGDAEEGEERRGGGGGVISGEEGTAAAVGADGVAGGGEREAQQQLRVLLGWAALRSAGFPACRVSGRQGGSAESRWGAAHAVQHATSQKLTLECCQARLQQRLRRMAARVHHHPHAAQAQPVSELQQLKQEGRHGVGAALRWERERQRDRRREGGVDGVHDSPRAAGGVRVRWQRRGHTLPSPHTTPLYYPEAKGCAAHPWPQPLPQLRRRRARQLRGELRLDLVSVAQRTHAQRLGGSLRITCIAAWQQGRGGAGPFDGRGRAQEG